MDIWNIWTTEVNARNVIVMNPVTTMNALWPEPNVQWKLNVNPMEPLDIGNNISLVVEFQRWWVLKSKLFGQESTCNQGKIFKKFLRVMTVCQKLGIILESKVVQKLSLEKKVFNK